MTWTDEDNPYVTAEKLIELLKGLPPGSIVAANRLGNLSVHDASLKQIGYIDIGSEEVEL